MWSCYQIQNFFEQSNFQPILTVTFPYKAKEGLPLLLQMLEIKPVVTITACYCLLLSRWCPKTPISDWVIGREIESKDVTKKRFLWSVTKKLEILLIAIYHTMYWGNFSRKIGSNSDKKDVESDINLTYCISVFSTCLSSSKNFVTISSSCRHFR